jgi:hypothetical protein
MLSSFHSIHGLVSPCDRVAFTCMKHDTLLTLPPLLNPETNPNGDGTLLFRHVVPSTSRDVVFVLLTMFRFKLHYVIRNINACRAGNTPYTCHLRCLYLVDVSYVVALSLSLEFIVTGKWFFVALSTRQNRH